MIFFFETFFFNFVELKKNLYGNFILDFSDVHGFKS